jgi:hypothetical protein
MIMQSHNKVIVLELNEITWDLMDFLLQKGMLPNFQALMKTGASGAPWASEKPEHLDPWVTWTTLYTGVPQEEHLLSMLEQDRQTLGAKRLWEYLMEAGLRIGLFGSANSWPPQTVDGFWIPGPFARDFSTYPGSIEAIQALNVGLTRGHTAGLAKPRLSSLVPKLVRLGLTPLTLLRLVKAMIAIRLNPTLRWKLIALQPLVNLDLFAHLYKRYQPDFATLHSNHVAYYQHRFWRAMTPEKFEVPPSKEEQAIYGGAIEHGYRIADKILGRLRRLCSPDTTLVVLSSCGQQPAVGGRYTADQAHGNRGLQIRIQFLLQKLGIADQVQYSNLMAPQWKIDIKDPILLQRTVTQLNQSRNVTRQIPCFDAELTGNSICLGARREQKMTDKIELTTCAGPQQFLASELLDSHAEVVKSGRHHPKGVLLIHGTSIRENIRIDQCDNLDIAPTLLRLLNQPIPSCMRGRVLEEALFTKKTEMSATAR